MTDAPHGDVTARLDDLERKLDALRAELTAVRALAAVEAAAPEASAVLPPAPASSPPQPPAERGMPQLLPKPVAPTPTPGAAAAAPKPVEPQPAALRRPPKPPRRTLAELVRDWDLVGARGFAIAGGTVMALGIGLFFVLAANRGWIDEQARVALGATASGLVLGAGLVLRARYGQYWSALAAVGAGIAGAYATLAAAAARYDLVPDGLALPLAGVIAAVGTVIAIRWRSQVIAAIGLLGASLAPALQALDTELTWESAAFAVIVLVAAGTVSVPRGWRELLASVSVIVGLQVEWLVADALAPAGAGTIAVASAFALCLLGISVGLQLVRERPDLDPAALTYALVSFGAALALAGQLLEERSDRGLALFVAAVVWAVVFGGLQWRRLPDLALVVGSSALALAAVGTADLLSDSALTIAWAAQGTLLAALAWRLGDARLRVMSIAYAALATAQALGVEARPGQLFDETAHQIAAVVPLAAVAVAATAAGLLAPKQYVERTESGLLSFVSGLRRFLVGYRRELRNALVFAGTALAILSAAFALVAVSFEWGHVLASALAATVGAVFLGFSSRQRSDGLAIASLTWLGIVLLEALVFDAGAFWNGDTSTSIGGWSVLFAAAGLLGGAYALRVPQPERGWLDVVAGIAAGIAFLAGWVGASLVSENATRLGLGVLVVASVYVGLAAGVFRTKGLRTFTTVLWSFGLVALVAAELLLVTDAVWRTVTVAATAFAVGALARPLREARLWLAGWSLALVTSAVSLIAQVQPWLGEGELARREVLASGACMLAALGLAALVWREQRWRDLATVIWVDGIILLLATERLLLDDWRATGFVVALTGAGLVLLAGPLGESRLWLAGAAVVGVTTITTITLLTPPSHFFVASETPADGLWVLVGCVLAFGAVALTAPEDEYRLALEAAAGGVALYAVSLGILEVAVRVSTASVETDFERGHTAVSGLWALVGLALLVGGLLRGSAAIRYGGLALFGLSLAKIFLYDLAELSSVARAFSFILVGGLLLAGGFFLQRLSGRIGPRHP